MVTLPSGQSLRELLPKMSQDKKIVHDLDIEALIKLATQSKVDTTLEALTDAAKFSYAMGIRHGDTPIPAQVVYHAYKQWKGIHNKKSPKLYFFRDFSKLFTRIRTKDGIFYMLEPQPFDLTESTYWLIRAELRHEKSRKKNKKK